MNIFKKNLKFLILTMLIILSCKPDIPLLAPGLVDNQVFNVSQPTISWLIPIGVARLEYNIDDGEWISLDKTVSEITLEEKLIDGVHTFAIRSIDAEGNASEARVIRIIIDTSSVTKPKPTVVGVNINNVTNNLRPVVVWDAIKDAVGYRVSVNGGAWIVYNSASKLNYVPNKDLVAGTYEFRVCALSSSGKWSDPGSIKITIVTESVVPQLNPNIRTSNQRPTWTWNVNQDEDNPILKFRYQINRELAGAWVETEAIDLGGSFTPEEDLLDGLYVLYVQALDSLGNWSISGTQGITVDTTPPAKPRIRGEYKTNNTNPVWTWTYADASDIARIEYQVDDNQRVEYEGNDMTSYQLESDDYDEDREYQFSLIVEDAVGNRTEAVIFKTEIDTSLPDKPVLSTDIDLLDGEYITRKLRPNWKWDVPANAVGFRYQLCIGEDAVVEANWIEVDTGITAYEPDYDFASNIYTLYIQAKNELGSWTDSASLAIEVDITPPAVPQPSGITPTGATQPAWNWALDPDVDKYLVRIVTGEMMLFNTPARYIQWGNASTWLELKGNITTFRPVNPLNTTSAIPGYHEFPYRFEIRALDKLGNASSIGEFVIIIDTLTPPSPVYRGVTRTNQAENFELTWTWTVSPAMAFSYQLINANNPVLGDDTAYNVLPGNLFTKKVNLTEGVNKLYLRGQDGSNLWSAPEESIIILDTVGPDKPVITGQEATNIDSFVWSWNVPADTYSFKYKIVRPGYEPGDASWYSYSVDNSSYNYEVPANSGDGDYTFILVALDDLGNASEEASFTTVYDTTPPAAPNVTGPAKINDPRPTWTWTADADCESFDVQVNGAGDWIRVNGFEFRPPRALATGENSLNVYAYDKAGNKSLDYGSYTIEIDLIPPSVPVFNIESPTSDRTPKWYWAPNPDDDPDDIDGYMFRLGESGEWAVVDADVTSYEIQKGNELPWGDYTLYLRARDEAGNYTRAVEGVISIREGALHTGLPKQFAFKSVSEGLLNCAVRLEWEVRQDCFDGLEGYEIERREFGASSGKILSLLNEYNVEEVFRERHEDGTYVLYDWTAALGKQYLYRIRGINDDVEGELQAPWSDMTRPESVEALRGSKLYAPLNGLSSRPSSAANIKLDWDEVRGANYRVLRAGPFADQKTASQLDSVTWNYQEGESSTWKEYGSSIDIESTKVIETNSFLDSGVTELQFYYYRVWSVAKVFDPKIEQEGLAQDGYNVSETYSPIVAILLPANIDSWLSVSDRDNSAQGKIKLTINVPAEHRPIADRLDFKISRTYRYGGGHRGFNAVDYGSNKDLSSHTSLSNPNPTTTEFEKTIFLDYDTNVGSSGTKVILDDLYDVNSAGERLYAVWNKSLELNSGGGYQWYERPLSIINANSSTYEIIKDPDETPSAHEWHYLKWDWVTRKFLQNPGNPRYASFSEAQRYDRFDFNEAVGCDYKLHISYKGLTGIAPVVSATKRGYPALTPREQGFLSMFLRELAFYEVPASFQDRIRPLGVGDAGSLGADITARGYKSGTLTVRNGGMAGLGAKADVKCADEPGGSIGFSHLPGCGVRLDWKKMLIMFGGPHKCFENAKFEAITPLYQIECQLTAFMMGGQYYHGLQPGSALSVALKVGANYGSYVTVPYQYANEYLGGEWARARGQSASSFFDRYTSINWKDPDDPNRAYPGF